MNILAKIILTPVIIVASWISGYIHESPLPVPQQEIQLGSTLPVNGSTYNLAGSGITSSATSIVLSNFTIPQTGQKILDADLSSTFYLTIEPGSRTRQEVVSCTTVVQNATTATLSGCSRGLSPISPYTASTSLAFAHAGGSQVILSNAAQLFNEYSSKQNAETITNVWTFDDNDTYRPRLDADTDTAVSTAFVTLGQLSRQAISGASDASETVKGITELATAIEQASSTSIGSTGAYLSLKSAYSSSTPSRGCNGLSTIGALCTIVARNDGTIHPNYIATSTSDIYRFQNLIIASSTHTATTSISASSLTNGAFQLNGLPYVFPSSRGSASTFLTENGSGTLSWTAPTTARYTYSNVSPSLSATNAYATSTFSFVIPALTSSSTIQFKGNLTCDNSADGDRSCEVYLRTSTGVDVALVNFSFGGAGSSTFGFDTDILRDQGGNSTWNTIGSIFNYGTLTAISTISGASIENQTTVDLSSGATLKVVVRTSGTNTTITLDNVSIIVNP